MSVTTMETQPLVGGPFDRLASTMSNEARLRCKYLSEEVSRV